MPITRRAAAGCRRPAVRVLALGYLIGQLGGNLRVIEAATTSGARRPSKPWGCASRRSEIPYRADRGRDWAPSLGLACTSNSIRPQLIPTPRVPELTRLFFTQSKSSGNRKNAGRRALADDFAPEPRTCDTFEGSRDLRQISRSAGRPSLQHPYSR